METTLRKLTDLVGVARTYKYLKCIISKNKGVESLAKLLHVLLHLHPFGVTKCPAETLN